MNECRISLVDILICVFFDIESIRFNSSIYFMLLIEFLILIDFDLKI